MQAQLPFEGVEEGHVGVLQPETSNAPPEVERAPSRPNTLTPVAASWRVNPVGHGGPPVATAPTPVVPHSSVFDPRRQPEAVHYIRHNRAKRYVVRVTDDGAVRVTIPRRGSRREAERFARSHERWIERQRERLTRATVEPRLSSGEARNLRARAARELPARLLELAQRFGLHVAGVSVRNQRSLWGSCSPRRHISLNWRLVTVPDWVRDYVLVHELMHLKRMDHSPAFWSLVAAACPGYRDARRWLTAQRHGILGPA